MRQPSFSAYSKAVGSRVTHHAETKFRHLLRSTTLRFDSPNWSWFPQVQEPTEREIKKVLIATNIGGHRESSSLDSLVSAALLLRGVKVHVLLCDAALEACMPCQTNNVWPEELGSHGPPLSLCMSCQDSGNRHYRNLPIEVHRLSEHLTNSDLKNIQKIVGGTPTSEISSFSLDQQAVGEDAIAGAIRYFATGRIPEGPTSALVLKRYFSASLRAFMATRNLLESAGIDTVVAHHGIYVPQGSVVKAARSAGCSVVTWNTSYRRGTVLVANGDSHHKKLHEESDDSWRVRDWNNAKRWKIGKYLETRVIGDQDWIRYNAAQRYVRRTSNLELPQNAYWLVLPNVFWDAQLHFPERAFPDQKSWLEATLVWARRNPDLQFIIRAHPGETSGFVPSRSTVDEVISSFGQPANVTVYPAQSPISSYTLMERAEAVLVFASKSGLEAATRGKAVVVAGEAWYRGKGFTYDARNIDNFFEILDGLKSGSLSVTQQSRDKALEYAYYLFFQRMIEIDSLEDLSKRWWRKGRATFRVSKKIKDSSILRSDPGLQLLVDQILDSSK